MPLHIGTCSWNYDSSVGLVYRNRRKMSNQQTFIEKLRDFLDRVPMVSDLVASGREVCLDVNNHYEGSAIETIERLKGYLRLGL